MSLSDFEKPKPAAPPEYDGPSADYLFAHFVLRNMALSDPLQFLAVTGSPEAERVMDSVFQDLARQCGRKTSFDGPSIKIHHTRVNACPCAVVEMPEPQALTEAFMVALVVSINTSIKLPPGSQRIAGRYFTLEKGSSSSNEPCTVLAEWDAEAHTNYGNGPAPNVDAFVAALSGHI